MCDRPAVPEHLRQRLGDDATRQPDPIASRFVKRSLTGGYRVVRMSGGNGCRSVHLTHSAKSFALTNKDQTMSASIES